MKRNKWFRRSAAALAVLLLVPQAQAAAPQPATDEAVYVNLDEYGSVTDMRVVKGVSLNGASSLSDYGSYAAVYNMTSFDEPQLRADGVDFQLNDVTGSRFYYECIPNDPESLQMPWTFDVSYKLDGVPVSAENLAGVRGLVEINLHAIPNPSADEYYRNNMILIVGTGIDMDKTKSLEAPGAQIQSVGSYKFAVFIGLPGEEDTYTVRIGSDSFESMGLYMLMAPATMSQLDTISDLRDVRNKLESAHDDLYAGLSDMLDTMDGMQSGIQSMADGIAGINDVRRQLIDARGTIDPDIDQALDILEVLAGDSEALIPELDTLQTNLNDIHTSLDSMLTTLTDSKADIADYQKVLKDLKNNLSNLSDMLDDIEEIADSNWLYISDIEDALKDLQNCNDDLNDSLKDLIHALDIVRRVENVLQDLLDVLEDLDLPGSRLEDSLSSLLSHLRAIGNACEDTMDNLRYLLEGMNELLDAGESAAHQLDRLNEVLEDYRGTGQDAAAIGIQAANLAGQTLDQVNTLLEQTEALQTKLTTANTDTNTLIPKVKTTSTTLTETLKAANTLLTDTRDTLRSLRGQSDASLQQSLDGLIDVMQRAANSGGTTNSLQNATDSIHNTISDEVDSIDEDSNVLNIDNSLALRSFTSDRNPSPSSLQFILRTSEISVDEAAELQEQAAEEKDIGVWGRIVNIFKKLFAALTEAFS